MNKTKKVDRTDLPECAFAHVGDPEDTSTWKLPIHFPGDVPKTTNHVRNALARFAETKGIPDSERSAVWLLIVGAALTHGIKVDRSQFAPKSEEPISVATPPPVIVKTKKDLELEAAIAFADRQAEAMLRAMGLD